MKNPIFSIGVLLFSIFLYDQNRRDYPLFGGKLIPTSCKAVVVKLEKRVPKNWTLKCEDNNLKVGIKSLIKKDIKTLLKPALYRNLANHLVFIAKNSPSETLERVGHVWIKVDHDQMDIEALTKGKDLSKFNTIKDKQFIADHLQATVQVKEKIK